MKPGHLGAAPSRHQFAELGRGEMSQPASATTSNTMPGANPCRALGPGHLAVAMSPPHGSPRAAPLPPFAIPLRRRALFHLRWWEGVSSPGSFPVVCGRRVALGAGISAGLPRRRGGHSAALVFTSMPHPPFNLGLAAFSTAYLQVLLPLHLATTLLLFIGKGKALRYFC